MSREQFERSKPIVNIGAINTVLAKQYGGGARAFGQIDNTPEEKARGIIIINAIHVQYDTPTRHYVHVNGTNNTDCVKGMITGSVQMDGVIVVVAADVGPEEQTREQIRLAKQTGVEYIAVVLNKCDLLNDEDVIAGVEKEVPDLLTEYDYPGYEVPVIRGSALKALEGETDWEAKIVELGGKVY